MFGSHLILGQNNMTTPESRKMSLPESSDTEDLFASPSRASKQPKPTASQPAESSDGPLSRSGHGASRYDTEQARNALLQGELEGVRGINEVIEGVVSSLECAKGNMEVSLSPIASTFYKAYI